LPTIFETIANVIKLFWCKSTHNFFVKLDHFTSISNTCRIDMKRACLQKRVSNFMPKLFNEIYPRANIINYFGVNSLTLFSEQHLLKFNATS